MAAAVAQEVLLTFSMVDSVKETLLASFRQLLRPLVRILLRHGISYGEYAEIAKIVFVEVASKDFQIEGKKQTQSRIAIITGLTRKDVSRVYRSTENSTLPSTSNLNRVGRVLSGWHQDPDFTGPYGLPLQLEFHGTTNSFSELVRRFSGDMPARAMLEELKRVGAVDILTGGEIRILTRSYIPATADEPSIQFMGVALRDLAETLDHNLNNEVENRYFERRVWTPLGITHEDVPRFRRLVGEKGQELIDLLDNWLTGKESEAETVSDDKKTKVGVGIYLFSDADRKFDE